MSKRYAVSSRRLRAYYAMFGLLGGFIMAASYGELALYLGGLYDGTDLALAGISLLKIGQLGQSLVCLAYIYVARQYPLLEVGSRLPERVVKLSMAIAVVVCAVRLGFTVRKPGYGWDYRAVLLLPLLLNLGFNIPLLQMTRQASESPLSGVGPSL